jgi:tol-pal system protein YbgF
MLAAGCIGPSQGKISRHDEAIRDLDQGSQEIKNAIRALRKAQADLSLEIDSMKQSLQTLQGTVEQNSLKTERTLAETKNIQNEVLSVLSGKDNQLSVLHNRLQVLESSSGKGTAPPPAEKPPNSVSGNNIEGVWSPTPYSALTKKQAAGSGGTAPQQTAALPQPPTPESVYNEAYNVLQAGNNRSAREQFKKFLNTYKSSELADNAQFWIGESYYREKKFEEAILSFEDLIKNYPKSAKISEAYYKQALSFSAINDSVAARAKLEMLLNEYPDGELAQRAKQKLQELEQQNPAETE